MSSWGFRPYVPVAERRAQGGEGNREARQERAARSRRSSIEGRKIARSFWGKAWCDNLERYSDFANRLPRGRTYVSNGSVIDLQIERGKVEALVSGSEIYKVTIDIAVARRRAGRRSAPTARARSARSSNSCRASCRRTSWSASAARPTVCSRRRAKSRCPAPAPTGRACASTSRPRSTASARGSTPIRTSCSRLRGVDRAEMVSTVGADCR